MTWKARISPESRELEAKRTELAALEEELAQRELDLTTLQAELLVFEARYLRVVGARFAERDELEARIAEASARLHPRDFTATRDAADARERALQSAIAAEQSVLVDTNALFTPSDDLKRLYREIAKLVHPDLTTDERERARRNRMMAAANRAFADGDQKELERLLEDWETSPEFVEGDGIGAELVRTIRKIHQANNRLAQIAEELDKLKRADLYELKARFDIARSAERDLLAEMTEHLKAEIAKLQERLVSAEKNAV